MGEPINPAAWEWYHRVIGKRPLPDRRYVVADGDRRNFDRADAGRCAAEAGVRNNADAGPDAGNRGLEGCSVKPGGEGFLILKPAVAEHDPRHLGRPRSVTRSSTGRRVPGAYFTGDAARCDEDGYYWVLGRVDDVMNVSGHRLSTMEVESALVKHSAVAEAAVVGKPHEITGQAVCCFVTLKKGSTRSRGVGQRASAVGGP